MSKRSRSICVKRAVCSRDHGLIHFFISATCSFLVVGTVFAFPAVNKSSREFRPQMLWVRWRLKEKPYELSHFLNFWFIFLPTNLHPVQYVMVVKCFLNLLFNMDVLTHVRVLKDESISDDPLERNYCYGCLMVEGDNDWGDWK